MVLGEEKNKTEEWCEREESAAEHQQGHDAEGDLAVQAVLRRRRSKARGAGMCAHNVPPDRPRRRQRGAADRVVS